MSFSHYACLKLWQNLSCMIKLQESLTTGERDVCHFRSKVRSEIAIHVFHRSHNICVCRVFFLLEVCMLYEGSVLFSLYLV